jgi:hypothetical protein
MQNYAAAPRTPTNWACALALAKFPRPHAAAAVRTYLDRTHSDDFKTSVLAIALAAATSLSLAADPIKIGVDGPFTGGSSSMGVSMRDVARPVLRSKLWTKKSPAEAGL